MLKRILDTARATVMGQSRRSKLAHFYSLYDKGTVLDVGVTDNEHNQYVNLFLNSFQLPARLYTGLAVESLQAIAKRHPGKTFVQYGGGTFPFHDKAFDWVFSNAVIEHVGSRKQQLEFLNEMLRVGRQIFFTTPNKYFPVEMHTNVLFRHWMPGGSFYRWCARNKPYWKPSNLNLLSSATLRSLLEESSASNCTIFRNRLLGWTMTFTVVCQS